MTVTRDWFSRSSAGDGDRTAPGSGAPPSFTLDPDADFTMERAAPVTVRADGVTDHGIPSIHPTPAADFSFTLANGVIEVAAHPTPPSSASRGVGPTTSPGRIRGLHRKGWRWEDFEGPPRTPGLLSADPAGTEDENPPPMPSSSQRQRTMTWPRGIGSGCGGPAQEFQGQTHARGVARASLSCGPATVDPEEVTLHIPSPRLPGALEGMPGSVPPKTLYVTRANVQLGRFRPGLDSSSSSGRLFSPTMWRSPEPPAAAVQDRE